MADFQAALHDHRQAVEAFLASARTVPAARWKEPRAPGKWSSAQITEHLALTYEAARGVLQGTAQGASAPRFLRPVIRTLLLRPVLRSGRFIAGAKAPKAFRPSDVPVSQEVLLARFQATAEAFAKYAAGAQGDLDHPFFGRLAPADFVRLQEIHTRHHRGQLPTG